jgi:hypothetical protein
LYTFFIVALRAACRTASTRACYGRDEQGKDLNTFGQRLILVSFNALQLCDTISIALAMQEGHKINV